MNAIEIEEAVSNLAAEPCDLNEFPFAFLEAFGNKDVTIKKLKAIGKSSTNKSDVEGGVLQRLNIHIAVTDSDHLDNILNALRESAQTEKAKVKYVLATDGEQIIAEELASGEVLSCEFSELGNNFGFFLTLAGISAVREVKDNPIDIKATSRLNKLYVELLKSNPDWATVKNQIAFNQFLARLVFCFFAEDTGVFTENGMFTNTVSQITESDGSNTHKVLKELFDAMDSDPRDGGRKPPVKSWADKFPYVNGGLFSGATDCPVFTRSARSYLLRAGELDWQAINPDIFGSMIQAVADDKERGSLGMHYTSVPNIEKVLNPLFLDSLNKQLEAAGDNARKLLNLRKRLSTICVFDPACGSGNFLVIAYIRMREIEAELMTRRGEPMSESIIKLTQFYGIEIKPFAVEVARLSLLIAEFQCNVRLIGQMQAQMLILPLHQTGHVVSGNALRLDWNEVCSVEEASEVFICGNPPYLGKGKLTQNQKNEMKLIFEKRIAKFGYIDFVACWLILAADFLRDTRGTAAFVTTNSICQGRQAPILWKEMEQSGIALSFAYTTFKWANSATKNAAVMCIIVGITTDKTKECFIYTDGEKKQVDSISPYLTNGHNVYVDTSGSPISEDLGHMQLGNKANDGGNLYFSRKQLDELAKKEPAALNYIKRIYGSKEFTHSLERYCLWIKDSDRSGALKLPGISERVALVKKSREDSPDAGNRKLAARPHQFREMYCAKQMTVVVPIMTSVNREYLPCGLADKQSVLSGQAFGLYDGQIWELALLLSRIHFIWIATICGRLKEDYRYSNDLGWNTFPLPALTENNKVDLTRCADDILLAREAHFPATIADLYKPDEMPPDLRAAHEYNDETLERIYIGRRFKNDTERLEKLFALYTEMTEESA